MVVFSGEPWEISTVNAEMHPAQIDLLRNLQLGLLSIITKLADEQDPSEQSKSTI
jgi:hypothetical protein